MSTPTVLYRHLLRNAHKMKDYNFRTYSVRRIKAGFSMNKNLQGEEAAAAVKYGAAQLEILKRQSLLTQLYPSAQSVMET